MEHNGSEILARTHANGNRLWTLTEDGELDEVVYKDLFDDDEIVWYEVSDMSHLHCIDPKTKRELYFAEIPTIEEAKRRIDLYYEQNPIED